MTQAQDAFNAAAELGLPTFDKKYVDVVIRGIKETTDNPSAAGNNTEVQFNDNGVLAGNANFTFDKTTTALSGGAFVPTGNTAPSNGLYLPSANSVAISTNGTGRLFVDANGKIGIGVSPGTRFQVANETTTQWSSGLSLAGSTNLDIVATTLNNPDTSITGPEAFLNIQAGGSGAAIHSIGVKRTGTGTGDLIFRRNVSGGSAESLRITSDGKVGLGTSSVSDQLEISNGTTDAANALGIRSGRYLNSAQEGAQLKFYSDQTASWLGTREVARVGAFGLASDHRIGSLAFALKTTNSASSLTEVMRLTPTGLGVGTTSPGSTLDVNGSINLTSNLTFSTTTSPFIAANAAGSVLRFGTGSGGVEQARIDSSGRLLVGTSSTSANVRALFQATSANSTGGGNIYLARGESTPADGADLGSILFSDSGHSGSAIISAIRDGGTWTSGTSQPTRLTFSTTADGASSPTERMRIGNVGDSAVYANNGRTVFTATTAGAANTSSVLFRGRYSATGTTDGTACFYVYANGDVENTNNSYGAISDIKLKENIVDANSQWSDIKALQVRNYNFKKGQTHTQLGLIAQEVELVSPGLVSESPDRDEDGNDLGTTTKSVNYSVLYMKAVKALQEAMERIETLEAKVAALEAN